MSISIATRGIITTAIKNSNLAIDIGGPEIIVDFNIPTIGTHFDDERQIINVVHTWGMPSQSPLTLPDVNIELLPNKKINKYPEPKNL